MAIKTDIEAKRARGQKMLAVLVDPEKWSGRLNAQPDFVLVGGSTGENTREVVDALKRQTNVPIVLFPGNVRQFTQNADALLMLSLISGRNAELLIGAQVSVARRVQDCGIDTLSVGYILVDGGRLSSVEKASGTRALQDKDEIVDTAIAAQLMGMESVYLEAGSGALRPVDTTVIQAVRERISIPLIVGGGIRTPEQMQAAFTAGADIVVIGNHFETHPDEIQMFCEARNG